MKKQYTPIRMPACRCGRQAMFIPMRKALHVVNPLMRKVGIYVPHDALYCVACPKCDDTECLAGTKRAAVAAFERMVEVGVR